jgi:hypothetical protein
MKPMTEQTTNTEPTTAGAKKLHATRDEANAAKPDKPRLKLFEVVKDGVSKGFCWTDGHAGAICIAARQDGYAARLADAKGGFFTKEMLAGRLAALTDEELAEMGLNRKKGGKK